MARNARDALVLIWAALLVGTAEAEPPAPASDREVARFFYSSQSDLEERVLRFAMALFSQHRLQLTGARVHLRAAEATAFPAVGEVRITWGSSDEGSEPRLPLRLRVFAEGSTWSAAADVTGRLHQEALVLARALRKAEPVTCDDTRVSMISVVRRRKDFFLAPCEMDGGLVMRRALAAGDTVSTSDVGPAPAVGEMQAVTIRVRSGSVVLESVGIAMADAEIGQTVKVKPRMSREIIEARVVAQGAVVPKEGGLR